MSTTDHSFDIFISTHCFVTMNCTFSYINSVMRSVLWSRTYIRNPFQAWKTLRLNLAQNTNIMEIPHHRKILFHRSVLIKMDLSLKGCFLFLLLRTFCCSGVGVTKPIFPNLLFSNFSKQSNQRLPVWYHIYIWHVSPQLSCGDTW